MLGLVELANAGITGVHNWSHNTRTPAHADAELRAHRESMLRARYAYGHIDLMPREEPVSFADVDRVKREYFSSGTAFEGLVHLGAQPARPFAEHSADLRDRHGRRAASASCRSRCTPRQTPPNWVDTEDFEKRGWLGPNLLLCHFVPARDIDAELMAKTKTPLSWATHSEFRLGRAGDPRVALLRMRKAGVIVSLSFDASSIAPPNMFETMRFTWNMGIPWRGTPSEPLPDVAFREVIEMATLNGAKALGIADTTGSITVGKRADIILDSRQRHQHRADRRHRGVGGAVGDAGQRRHRAGRRPHRQTRRQARGLRRRQDRARGQGFGAADQDRGGRQARAEVKRCVRVPMRAAFSGPLRLAHSIWNFRRFSGCIAVNCLRASALHRARRCRGSSSWTSQPLLNFSRSRMRWRSTSSAWLGLAAGAAWLDGTLLTGRRRRVG